MARFLQLGRLLPYVCMHIGVFGVALLFSPRSSEHLLMYTTFVCILGYYSGYPPQEAGIKSHSLLSGCIPGFYIMLIVRWGKRLYDPTRVQRMFTDPLSLGQAVIDMSYMSYDCDGVYGWVGRECRSAGRIWTRVSAIGVTWVPPLCVCTECSDMSCCIHTYIDPESKMRWAEQTSKYRIILHVHCFSCFFSLV